MPANRAALWPAFLAALLVLGASLVPRGLAAQRPARQWEPRGFDFRADGVWRPRARRVANTRAGLIARRDFASLNSSIENARGFMAQLNAPGALGAPAVVSGVLNVPVFLVRFKNTDTTTLRAPRSTTACSWARCRPSAGPTPCARSTKRCRTAC